MRLCEIMSLQSAPRSQDFIHVALQYAQVMHTVMKHSFAGSYAWRKTYSSWYYSDGQFKRPLWQLQRACRGNVLGLLQCTVLLQRLFSSTSQSPCGGSVMWSLTFDLTLTLTSSACLEPEKQDGTRWICDKKQCHAFCHLNPVKYTHWISFFSFFFLQYSLKASAVIRYSAEEPQKSCFGYNESAEGRRNLITLSPVNFCNL